MCLLVRAAAIFHPSPPKRSGTTSIATIVPTFFSIHRCARVSQSIDRILAHCWKVACRPNRDTHLAQTWCFASEECMCGNWAEETQVCGPRKHRFMRPENKNKGDTGVCVYSPLCRVPPRGRPSASAPYHAAPAHTPHTSVMWDTSKGCPIRYEAPVDRAAMECHIKMIESIFMFHDAPPQKMMKYKCDGFFQTIKASPVGGRRRGAARGWPGAPGTCSPAGTISMRI